jgi:hypothetical protein
MPYPIQPVTAFSEAELWYMYQQLIEINTNTAGGGGGGGLSQTQLYEVFNGTNPEGFAVSLFESLSGNNNSLSNLLIEDKSGSFETAANLLYFILQKETDIEINTGSASTTLLSIDTNTLNSATSLSNIDGTTQTIEGYSQNIQNNTSAISTNTLNSSNSLTSINNQISILRFPEVLSSSASGTIAVITHNISIANVGSATGTITVNGTTVNLLAGVSIDYNSGGLNNRFAANLFSYNATGTTFLIQYVR